MIRKTILAALLMLVGMTGTQAQTWNFTTVSDEDIELLNADATLWQHDTSGSNNRYNTATALDKSALTANGTELDYARGLLFTSVAGSTRIDVKGKRMWLGGSTKLYIPNVGEGQVITVIAMSSKNGEARGIGVSEEQVELKSGNFNKTTAERSTNVAVAKQTGEVELTMNGAMYIYEISVADADDDDDNGGEVEPTPQPGENDYSTSANASKNQMVLTLSSGNRYYNTAELTTVDIEADRVTVSQPAGNYTYSGTVKDISFVKAANGKEGEVENAEGKVSITEARGWLESAYVKFLPYDGARGYHIYIRGGRLNDFTLIDNELVRNYGAYGRADVLGLAAADDYAVRVVPVDADGQEIGSAANEATGISVAAYDRSGFAHKGLTEGIGAYNNDGTLKQGTQVVYVTKGNAKTVSLDIVSSSKGATTTYTGLQQIIYGYQKGYETRPLDIRLIGCITAADVDEFLSSSEGIQIKGKNSYMPMHITIEGVGDDATTSGFGFLIRNAASIELRNFANMLCMDDAVSIDTDNEHIWVHNLDLFYGNTGGDADQAKGDGTIDLKGDSRYITISYNHLWDSGKASLCGMKSESGPNWITYHHNWFDHSDSRHPRIRTMSVHVWNNYFDGNAKYGVGAAYRSNAFVEANYFRACKYPMLISKQGSDIAGNPKGTFSGEDGGMIKSFANRIVGAKGYVTYQQNATQFDAYEAQTRDEQVPATVVAQQGGRVFDNWDTDNTIMYDYTPDAADDVPAKVTGWLGAGRLAHGDFQWAFDNSTEDANYEVIAALKKALQDYKSTLVGSFDASGSEGGDEGGEQGEEQGGQTVEGTVVCSFDKSGNPSSTLFTVSGNGASNKGEITVDGVTYSTCLKMEQTTSVKFTLSQPMQMTLYFGPTETASIMIDGTKISGSGNTYTTTLEDGAHELTKDKSVNLFLIKLVPVE